MNMSVDWMQLTDAVGAWLSTYLLHSTVLLVPALLLGRFLGGRRLSLQESVLRVALVGGILTATLQCGLGWQAATGTIPYKGLKARGGTTVSAAAAPARSDSRLVERSITRTGVAPSLERPTTSRAAVAAADIPWLALAVGVWAFGALLLIGRLASIAWRLRHQLRDRDEITGGGVFRLFWRLLAAADVDKPTRLTRTPHLQLPVALGVGRREICLPDRVCRQMPREQQETVLAHELAHLERSDPTWLLLGRSIESILFLQPLNRLAGAKLQEIAEYRCDDWAALYTGRPLTLARCLTEVASWSVAPSSGALAPTMAGNRSGLGRRVRRLLDPGYSGLEIGLPGWWRPLAAAALAFVLIAVPGFSIVGQEDDSSSVPAAEAPQADTESDEATPAEAPEALEQAPVIGPDGIVGPTDEFDVSAPRIAPSVPVDIMEVPPALAPVAVPFTVRVPLLAPAARVEAAPYLAPSVARVVVPVVVETAVVVEARVAVALAPRVAIRIAPRISYKLAYKLAYNVAPRAEETQLDARPHERHDDWDDDWDEDLEDELDALEDEIDDILDEIEDSLEFEFEMEIDDLEDEMDALEDALDEIIESELESFEDAFEIEIESFEEEMERLEDRVEERLDKLGWDSREERFETDIERIEDQVDRLSDRIDDQLDSIEDRLEDRLESRWEYDFEHGLNASLEKMNHRLEAESHRIERMAYELAEKSRGAHDGLSTEDRHRLLDEARRAAGAARPSAEEMAALHEELERIRSTALPSTQELEALRQELRVELERLRVEIEEGLVEQHQALDRLSSKHKIL